MADEEGFDIGRDLLVFLASVLDKTEYIFQNDQGERHAEAHAAGYRSEYQNAQIEKRFHHLRGDRKITDELLNTF